MDFHTAKQSQPLLSSSTEAASAININPVTTSSSITPTAQTSLTSSTIMIPPRFSVRIPRTPRKLTARCCLRTRQCFFLFTLTFPRALCIGLLLSTAYIHSGICWGIIQGFPGWFLGVVGLFINALAVIAYFKVLTGPGSPLDLEGYGAKPIHRGLQLTNPNTNHNDGNLEDDEMEEWILPPAPASILNSIMAKDNGKPRYCHKCRCWKPDRTHHCSSCGKCVLLMDHHCPWFATCIGFHNRKFFIQFLTYTWFWALFSLISSGIVMSSFFVEGDYNDAYLELKWVFLFVIAIAVIFAVGIFDGYSIYLLCRNITTLESMETTRYKSTIPSNQFRFNQPPNSKSVGNIFDLGCKENWRQIMGRKRIEWFLPLVPKELGNGTEFLINPDVWDRVMRNTRQEEDGWQRYRMSRQQQQRVRNPQPIYQAPPRTETLISQIGRRQTEAKHTREQELPMGQEIIAIDGEEEASVPLNRNIQ